MRDRKSVLMVIYDLPTLTSEQRRDAQKFRKKLIASGFLSLQESVYVKLLRNASGADSEVAAVQQLAPREGVVQVIPMSLQVFQNMRTLTGEGFNMKVFADDLIFF
ncbi:MAG: CRISPR-associated endonuclease Cas2 [Clostridia bacterium]|nr:CRISPR-associated endonuclease Cas2 [Clostridia bacterium]